eukprot:GDKJ01012260.1.p1 GENE.GDKJ01012260.1~~GDKJ01012260.1.p1  ORF type:complete len:473 (+),score=89.78 GDKJ01012260.1:70-1488(+)
MFNRLFLVCTRSLNHCSSFHQRRFISKTNGSGISLPMKRDDTNNLAEFHPTSGIISDSFGVSVFRHALNQCESSREIVRIASQSKVDFNSNDVYLFLTRLKQLGNVKKGGHEWQKFVSKCTPVFSKCNANQIFAMYELVIEIKASHIFTLLLPQIEKLSDVFTPHQAATIICGFPSLQSLELDLRPTAYKLIPKLSKFEDVKSLEPPLLARTANAIARLDMKADTAKHVVHLACEVAYDLLKAKPENGLVPAHAVRLLWACARLEVGTTGGIERLGRLIVGAAEHMEASDLIVAERCLRASGFVDVSELKGVITDLAGRGLVPELTNPFEQRRKKGFKTKLKRVTMSDPLPFEEEAEGNAAAKKKNAKDKVVSRTYDDSNVVGRAKIEAIRSNVPPEIAQIMLKQAQLASLQHQKHREEGLAMKKIKREKVFGKENSASSVNDGETANGKLDSKPHDTRPHFKGPVNRNLRR